MGKKLADVLAENVAVWPKCATHAVIKRINSRETQCGVSFTENGAPVWKLGTGFTICHPDLVGITWWLSGETISESFGFSEDPANIVTRQEWEKARAIYLSTVQPERDPEIKELVELAGGKKQLPYAFTEADIRAAFAAGANWVRGGIEEGAVEYVNKLKWDV